MTGFKNYSPVVAAEESLPEMTVKAVLLGIILSLFFAIGNAFIGLKSRYDGFSLHPSICNFYGDFTYLFKRSSILENNIVQTMASAGEALASGVIFTVPTLYFLGSDISIVRTFFLSILGGFLGIFYMLPMREHFVVKEHGKLLFPEGTACAEILKAGEKGAKKALLAIYGVLVGGAFRFCTGFLSLWPEVLTVKVRSFRNAVISLDTTPALLGVGFIIGPKNLLLQ